MENYLHDEASKNSRVRFSVLLHRNSVTPFLLHPCSEVYIYSPEPALPSARQATFSTPDPQAAWQPIPAFHCTVSSTLFYSLSSKLLLLLFSSLTIIFCPAVSSPLPSPPSSAPASSDLQIRLCETSRNGGPRNPSRTASTMVCGMSGRQFDGRLSPSIFRLRFAQFCYLGRS